MALPVFDNHDARICYWELMLQGALDGVPEYPLPDGFRFAFYQPGDRDAWVSIEKSAKELADDEEGLKVWNRFFGDREGELPARMCFVVDGRGEKVATATALYDIYGRDRSGAGWLHWVAVRRDAQGKGLSKPLITHVLSVMRSLGYTHAKIPTQTTTWLAVKVYLDLGFRPIPANAVHSGIGWRIIRRLTDHPALAAFEPAGDGEVLANGELRIRRMVPGDYDRAWSLWTSCGNMGLNDRDDSEEGVRRFLERNPSTCFVAQDGERLLGTVLSGHDGRRGYIYHLAVEKDARRRGIGTALVEKCLDALRAEGIGKAALLVFCRSETGNAFWEKQGFTARTDIRYRNRALAEMTRLDT